MAWVPMLWKQSRRMAAGPASGPGVSFLLHLHVHPLPAEAPAGVAYQEMSTVFTTRARGEFPAAWVYKYPLKMFLTCYVAQEFKMSFCSQKSHRIFLSKASFEFTFRSFSALLSNFSAGESLRGRRGASCRLAQMCGEKHVPCPSHGHCPEQFIPLPLTPKGRDEKSCWVLEPKHLLDNGW